jgi:hypothetical protein
MIPLWKQADFIFRWIQGVFTLKVWTGWQPSQTRRWSRLKPNWYGRRQKQQKTKLGRNRGILKTQLGFSLDQYGFQLFSVLNLVPDWLILVCSNICYDCTALQPGSRGVQCYDKGSFRTVCRFLLLDGNIWGEQRCNTFGPNWNLSPAEITDFCKQLHFKHVIKIKVIFSTNWMQLQLYNFTDD